MSTVEEIIGEWSSWSIGSGSDNLPIMMGSQNVIDLILNHNKTFVLDDTRLLPTIPNRATSLYIDRGDNRIWYIVDMPYAHQLPSKFLGRTSLNEVVVGYIYTYIDDKKKLKIPLYDYLDTNECIPIMTDSKMYFAKLNPIDNQAIVRVFINGKKYKIY